MNNTTSQHESVRPSHFRLKQRAKALLKALGYGRQKVRDVIEESTTNNWQQHMAVDTAHLTYLCAFLSCVSPVEAVQK